MIDKLVKENIPFAILRYKTWLAGSTTEGVRYELMHNKYKVIAYKVLNQDEARSAIRKYKLTKVVDKDYGAVYEFNNFKQIINK